MPLTRIRSNSAQHRGRPQGGDGGAGEQHRCAIIFVGAFEPRGEVHAVADHRVFQTLFRTDRAGDNFAGGEADADIDRLEPGFGPAQVERPERADHAGRDEQGVVGIGAARHRRAKDRHQPVAHVFVEHAAVRKDHLDHLGKVIIEHRHRVARAHRLGERGEMPDVGKQHRSHQGIPLQHVVAAGE